jgi:hypothetical protein
MESDSLVGCCGLKEIHDLNCLGGSTAYEEEDAKYFDVLLKQRIYNSSATILTLSTEVGLKKLRKQREFVRKRGFKLLGQWRSLTGRRIIYLYGSKEFRMPRGRKK